MTKLNPAKNGEIRKCPKLKSLKISTIIETSPKLRKKRPFAYAFSTPSCPCDCYEMHIVINSTITFTPSIALYGHIHGCGCVEMAEKVLQDVEDQLNCSVCLDTYTDPKLLQCYHIYCQKCLVKLVVRDQQGGQLTLTCPTCRHTTPVPANGVTGLQPAFQINHLLEVVEKHKKAAVDPSASANVERDSTSLTPHDKIKVCCPEHGGKEVELYCETCGEPICVKCALKGGKHHSHDYEELDKAFAMYKVEITASLGPMEKQLTTINKALAQLNTCCGEISDQQAAIEADIHITFRKIHSILSARKSELIGQLHQITQRKLKGLAVLRDQLETTLARISSCLGFMRDSLKSNKAEVLKMKKNTHKQVKELTTTFPPDMLKPNTEADTIFLALADVSAACQKYGQVSASSSPDPSQCYAMGKGLEVAAVGKTSTAVLQAVDYMGRPCVKPVVSSEIELVSELTGTRIRGSIERTGQSQYKISYQPTIKGRHQLHIKVEAKHITESPFTIRSKSPVEKLGTPILTLSEVKDPYAVAVNQRGEVVVADYGAHCISVFSYSGRKLRSFGTQGSCQGQFDVPRGVAVDGNGNIFVADLVNHRIQKFTVKGQFVTAVGTKGNGPPQFDAPKGIAFNASNYRMYITDSNHRVQVLNSDLTYSCTFGKHGSGKGHFDSPRGIACDSTGKVYVADRDNHRIQVFTAEGKFLRMFGKRGEGRGELKFPIDVAIGTNDIVYVCENRNHRVSVFTSEGVFVTSFGSCGPRPGQFEGPCSLAVNNDGVVYVCDHRVQLF